MEELDSVEDHLENLEAVADVVINRKNEEL